MNKLLVLILFVVGAHQAYGQYTSAANGPWTTNSTWSPSTGQPSTSSLAGNVTINKTVTLSASSLTGFTGGTTITINSGGTLQVAGDLSLTGSGINIVVNSGGVLDVSAGTITTNNSSQITLSGGTVKAVNLTMPDFSSTKFNYSSGTLTLTGNLTVGNGVTFAYTPSLNIPGNININNASTTIVASHVGGSITLANSSKLSLTAAGTETPSSISISGNSELAFAGGTLNYTGSATSIPSGSKFTVNSGTVNLQSLTVDGSFVVNSGTLGLTSSLTVDSGSTFTYGSALNIPGNVSINNGSTYTASNVGGSITLTNNSKLNLTTSGTVSPSSIAIGSGSELAFSGGTLNYTGTALSLGGTLTLSGGTTNLQNVTVNNSGGILNINGGTLNAQSLTENGTMSLNNAATLNVTNLLSINSSFTTASGTTLTAGSLTITNSGSTTMTNNGTTTISGDVTENGPLTNNGTFNVGGNYNSGGGGSSTTVNNGIFNLTGNMDLPSASKFTVNPGGVTTVTGSVTTHSNQNLIVGTNASGPPYADMIIKKNLISQGSGDVLVDKNGRLAVFGNISSDGSGGTIFTFNQGSQVYVGGTSTFTGGGDHLANNNTGTPYTGFYTNSPPTYSGGGSGSTGTAPMNTTQLKTDDPSFYSWLGSISGSPLPVTLTLFEVKEVKETSVVIAWETASEKNFNYFIVEKSADGINFTSAGKVQGHGTTNISHDYQFEDTNPSVGKNYYRLKSVDFDNYTETFSIVYASFEGQKTFTISPNPNDGETMSAWTNFGATENSVVIIFDNAGSALNRFDAKNEKTDITFSTPLKSGMYYAKYIAPDYSEIVRFIVK